jgi:hypothetical protein
VCPLLERFAKSWCLLMRQAPQDENKEEIFRLDIYFIIKQYN